MGAPAASDVLPTSMASALTSYELQAAVITPALSIRPINIVVTPEPVRPPICQDFSRLGAPTLIATPRMTRPAHLPVPVEPTIGLSSAPESLPFDYESNKFQI